MVADTYGHNVDSFSIEIAPELRTSGRTLVMRQAGSVTLPYGSYVVRGTASLHETFERQIILEAPRSAAPHCLPL
jgi:hypothetical protein